jgi:hypothetical protein
MSFNFPQCNSDQIVKKPFDPHFTSSVLCRSAQRLKTTKKQKKKEKKKNEIHFIQRKVVENGSVSVVLPCTDEVRGSRAASSQSEANADAWAHRATTSASVSPGLCRPHPQSALSVSGKRTLPVRRLRPLRPWPRVAHAPANFSTKAFEAAASASASAASAGERRRERRRSGKDQLFRQTLCGSPRREIPHCGFLSTTRLRRRAPGDRNREKRSACASDARQSF